MCCQVRCIAVIEVGAIFPNCGPALLLPYPVRAAETAQVDFNRHESYEPLSQHGPWTSTQTPTVAGPWTQTWALAAVQPRRHCIPVAAQATQAGMALEASQPSDINIRLLTRPWASQRPCPSVIVILLLSRSPLERAHFQKFFSVILSFCVQMLLLDIFFDWAVSSRTSNHVRAKARTRVSPACSVLIPHLYILLLSIMQLVLFWKWNRQFAISLLCLEFSYTHAVVHAGWCSCVSSLQYPLSQSCVFS